MQEIMINQGKIKMMDNPFRYLLRMVAILVLTCLLQSCSTNKRIIDWGSLQCLDLFFDSSYYDGLGVPQLEFSDSLGTKYKVMQECVPKRSIDFSKGLDGLVEGKSYRIRLYRYSREFSVSKLYGIGPGHMGSIENENNTFYSPDLIVSCSREFLACNIYLKKSRDLPTQNDRWKPNQP
jgi:hypothetical protein